VNSRVRHCCILLYNSGNCSTSDKYHSPCLHCSLQLMLVVYLKLLVAQLLLEVDIKSHSHCNVEHANKYVFLFPHERLKELIIFVNKLVFLSNAFISGNIIIMSKHLLKLCS